MKKYLLILPIALALGACNKSSTSTTPDDAPYEATIDPTTINMASMNPEAVEYFKDLGVMAEWYSSHRSSLQAAMSYNATHDEADTGYNELVQKFNIMDIQDEQGNSRSFFDLPEDMRQSFLRDFVKEEANALTEKLNDAGSTRTADFLADQNAAVDHQFVCKSFSDSMDFSDEALKITSPNEYGKICGEIRDEIEPAGNAGFNAPGGQGTSMQNFLGNIVGLGFLNPVTITYNPYCKNVSPQQFVDRIRGQIAPGRVLVALPGGDDAVHPVVFNGFDYDVGHVAIIDKNMREVPANITDNYSFSIGTNSDKGMHREEIKDGWTAKHGMTYVMEPIRITIRYETRYGTLGIPYPYWARHEESVTNGDTYNQIVRKIGTPYCSIPEFLYSQKVAPDRFICSSSAWWAIKTAHNIDLNEWYKTTIFPSGVYLSSDMRTIGKTF